jgi:hypothetical protein
MSLDEEKKMIIREVLTIQDERIIEAIKKLLEIDTGDDFSPAHKQILEERLEEYKKNPSDGKSLEEFIEELKSEGKL